jgi:N-acetylglutamate synthase-like GNAT family acetyltransferase
MAAAQPQQQRRKRLTSGISNITLRKAVSEDLPVLKTLADAHRHELGFVHRQALLRSINKQEVIVAQNTDKLVGFVEYHHRRDQQTTIYHIVVDPEYRGQGIGHALIEALRQESYKLKKRFIRIKCPEDLKANRFYEDVGCQLIKEEEGKQRALLIWELGTNGIE